MANSIDFRNKAVNAVAQNAAADYFSLHSADPSTTGANEISGGTYGRVASAFPASTTGSATNSGATLNVPAGNTITHWGRWTAATGGSFFCGGALPAPETFGAAGTYTLTNTVSQGSI
jgi:hypothetical protein